MPTLRIKKKNSSKKQGPTVSKVISDGKFYTNMNKYYLDFDYDIDEEFKKTLPSIGDKEIDYEKITNLPKFGSKISKNKVLCEEFEDESEDLENENISSNPLPEDVDELDKHMIGNNIYYIDYNKGIIYNTNYNIIGIIDDNGDIDIDHSKS